MLPVVIKILELEIVVVLIIQTIVVTSGNSESVFRINFYLK